MTDINQITDSEIQYSKTSELKNNYYHTIYNQKYKKQLKFKDEIESVAILPAINLENCIEAVVKRTKYYVDKVLVISDGSSDKTNLKARCAGAQCPPHTNKIGKGYALRKGIQYSKRFKPKYIILMDSDGQHLPEEIPKFLHNLRTEKKDMVLGSRFKGILKTSLIHRFGNSFLNILFFMVTGKWFSDIESGFRGFVAKKLYNLNLDSINYEIDFELLFKSLCKGFKIKEVPITVPKAIPGIKVLDGIKIALYALRKGISLNFRRSKIPS